MIRERQTGAETETEHYDLRETDRQGQRQKQNIMVQERKTDRGRDGKREMR